MDFDFDVDELPDDVTKLDDDSNLKDALEKNFGDAFNEFKEGEGAGSQEAYDKLKNDIREGLGEKGGKPNFEKLSELSGIDADELEDKWNETDAGKEYAENEDIKDKAEKARIRLKNLKIMNDLIDKAPEPFKSKLKALRDNFNMAKADLLGDSTIKDAYEEYQKNPSLEKLKDLTEKLHDKLKNDTDFGRNWRGAFSDLGDYIKDKLPGKDVLSTVAKLLALALLTGDLLDFLNKAGKSESGCWSENSKDGSRCKITQLTCDTDDLSSGSTGVLGIGDTSFDICQPCTGAFQQCESNYKSGSSNTWYPLLQDSKACSDNTAGTLDWQYAKDATLTVDSPISSVNTTCDSSKTGATGATPACSNFSGCVSWNEACNQDKRNSDCSNLCSSSLMKNFQGQSFTCKQVSGFEALMAMGGKVLRDAFQAAEDAFDGSGLFSGIEKILMWVAIGIVGLIIGYVVIKTVINKTANIGEENSENSEN